jgi:hypothetical protein
MPGPAETRSPEGSGTQQISDQFTNRISVLYLLPDERFAFFTLRRGYEETIAACQWGSLHPSIRILATNISRMDHTIMGEPLSGRCIHQ